MKNHAQTITLRNAKRVPLAIRIEPWADEITLRPGGTVELRFEAPEVGPIEVEVEGDVLVVYGWVGSTVTRIQGRGEGPDLGWKIIEGDGAVETCESNGIDRGSCSRPS